MVDGMTVHATLTGLSELKKKLAALSDAAAGQALERAATAGALPIQNAAKQKAPRKTRTLSRSIHTEVVESNRDHATVNVGTDLEYAAIQEFGGTIVPKHGKYLAIPLNDTARSYPPRSFPGKLHIQGQVLADADGKPQYALKTSVTIPAQPYLRPALAENSDKFVRDAGDALRQALTALGAE